MPALWSGSEREVDRTNSSIERKSNAFRLTGRKPDVTFRDHQPLPAMRNTTPKSVILYVDDDSDDCSFLKASLEDSGGEADLVCSPDGEEAVRYLDSVDAAALPSLIVLDLNMPRWGGQKTLHYIKSQPRLAAIPVVILSTSENEKEKQACKQLGAVSYYEKPHHFNGYKNIVAGFFSVMNPAIC